MRHRKTRKLSPPRGSEDSLTYAEQDDGGADVNPSHDTAGVKQGAIRKLENPQKGEIVAYEFVQLAALWTPEFTS